MRSHMGIRRTIWIASSVLALVAFEQDVDSIAASTDNQRIATAEAFIDAFYSFESDALLSELSFANESQPYILYYQGWAQGGNYEVVERNPCEETGQDEISCSITVKDDLIGALGIDFNVTDTFHLTYSEGKIVAVATSSNDPQAYYDAENWVRENQPEVFEGPCRGWSDGGPTPGDCVRAMVSGYSQFAANAGLSETPDSPD